MEISAILERFPLLKNKFFLAGLVFFLWVGFVDENSLWERIRLEQESLQLEKDKEYFQEKIKEDAYQMEQLDRNGKLEIIAREKYLMKKYDEEIFIIQKD